MSNNAINVRTAFTDSLGRPRSNGLVYFYENKTTTLATIYSDELLTIPQANPYTLDAFGRIRGDVKYTGSMTVKHTNSNGSDSITDDDVTAGGSSASSADQFKVTESAPQAMTVTIKAGNVMNGETLVTNTAQTTTTIVAPVSNPRIDRIVINRLTGVYAIIAGSEAASPAAPAITAGNAPAAQILLQVTSSVITDAMITDERISGSVEPSNANTTETLTNKTLTLPVISSISNTGTITLPTGTRTLVGRDTTDTLTNKTIGDTNTINAQDDAFTIDDAADPTKQIDFNAAGTTGTKTTITSSQTANRVITLPDETGTLAFATVGSWTATLDDAASNAATSTSVCRYVKIGRLVTISGRLDISSVGSIVAGNVLRIQGLPFASETLTNVIYSIHFGAAFGLALTAGYNVSGYITSNQSQIELMVWRETSGVNNLLGSHITATTTLLFGGSYIAAS